MALSERVPCWGNPVIKVNFTDGRIDEEVPDKKLRKKFLIARGLSDWWLFKSVEPGKTDPLSPDNVMLIGSGILIGTLFPGAVRTNLVSLNTLTDAYGESSAGGTFSVELKRAGYDGIALYGKSPNPVYLWINDGNAEIRDATHLWGKTTFESDMMIREELKDTRIKTMSIGPAGENLVRFACINVANRYSGRCGMGAVMGSKNLKAIAVRGTRLIEAADSDRIRKISEKVRDLLKKDPRISFRSEIGMAGTNDYCNELGLIGIKNFQSVYFDRAYKIGYNAVKKYYKKVIYIPGCPVYCDRLVEIPKGEPYGGTQVNAMEATPAYNFAHFLIDDINTVIKGFELCNAYGIDVHSWSNVIQWAIECYERGILTEEDTDGLDLRWGDGPLLLESIRRITYREGEFANLLAEGVSRASKKIERGSEKYAMHMKGMEIDDELRVAKGWALGIMTELRGPGHTLGAWTGELSKMSPQRAEELYGTENAAKPLVYDDKADLVVLTERSSAIWDCLGICFFANYREAPQIYDGYNIRTFTELIEAATGWEVSDEELLRIAERILTIEKSINVLAGLNRRDDIPPDRFFEPIPDGPFKDISLDREKVIELLRRHDKLHGWDPETGIPTRETLEALDLKEVIDKFKTAGRLLED